MPDNTTLERLDRTGIRSDDDVVDLVAALLGRALVRRCWLLFLTARGIPVRVLIPVDDIPLRPDDDGLAGLATLATAMIEHAEAATVVVVWEDERDTVLDDDGRAWVDGVWRTFTERGVRLRGQVLLHPLGATWLSGAGGPRSEADR